jgi:AraC-like DNA-binding protein
LRRVDVVGVDGEMGGSCLHRCIVAPEDLDEPPTFRRIMSISRRVMPAVRSYSITHPPGLVSLPTEAAWDQLVYAESGLFTAHAESRAWTIPAYRALCVLDGTRLQIETTRRSAIRCVYFASRLDVLTGEARVVSLDSLMRELIAHAVRKAPIDLSEPADAALITLFAEARADQPALSLRLPLPADPVVRAIATAVMSDPASSLDTHLQRAGASRRSSERRFRIETGMSIGQWRTRARILAAVALLSEGDSVTRVAMDVGYATPSSFVAAFRSELHASPREFMRPRR